MAPPAIMPTVPCALALIGSRITGETREEKPKGLFLSLLFYPSFNLRALLLARCGVPLVAAVSAPTIVVGRGLDGLPDGVRVTEDRYAVRSPLVGIHAGLAASRTDLAFVTACDMPHVEPTLVEFLLEQAAEADVVVPVVRGYYEPLCAVYRRSCITSIEDLIERGVLKVSAPYGRVRLREIAEPPIRQHVPDLRSFVNLDPATPSPPTL